ncbi:hypothetical protein B4168_4180 [Anoxybacillus flavithermus]|nr:hypothetical protein B4168_4180 [Anoxybacillus flavithermus]OAO87276.1 hypothetical protein GT23_1325 [Parageobacillus thermoglucosidasius]
MGRRKGAIANVRQLFSPADNHEHIWSLKSDKEVRVHR